MHSQQLVSFIYVDVFSSALFEQRGKFIGSISEPTFKVSRLHLFCLLPSLLLCF